MPTLNGRSLPYYGPRQSQREENADFDRAEEALRAAYREHLGREITDDEIEGWWTGQYGWGAAGIDGLGGWIRGIETEGARLKAANQPAPSTTPVTYEDGGDVEDPRGPMPTGSPNVDGQPPDPPDLPGSPIDPRGDPVGQDPGTETETPPFDGFEGLLERADAGTLTEADLAWLQPHFAAFDFADDPQESASLAASRSGAFRHVLRGLGATGAIGGGDTERDDTERDDTERDDTERDDTERDDTDRRTSLIVDPDDTGRDDKIPPWTQPLGSPLFNPPATQGPPGMGGYGMAPGGGGGTMGAMITPYNPLATYSPVPYVTPAPFRPPAYQGAIPFGQDPYAAATPFTGPTAEQMTADPGYQFRLRQGQEALERSGAARGVTNTGGTLRDILDYGQQAASQEYGNVFGRQRDVYDLNERNRFNAYQANYGNAMDAYAMNERNRAGAFATNVGTARDAYAMNVENRYQGYTTNELARWQENQEAENRRSGAYGTNLGGYERQQQYGLRAQGQGFDQSFRNWQEQYNQGRMNAQDTYNRMYGLSTA